MGVSTLVDLVKIRVLSSGTGPFNLGPAVPGFRGVEALIDSAIYSYSVQSGSTYEIGTGVYLASGQQLVRTPFVSSSGNVAVSFPANVELVFTALAQDLEAIGGAFPILNSLGNSTSSAISQKAATDGINAAADAADAAVSGLNTFKAALLSATALNGPNLIAWFHDETAEPGSLAAAWQVHANPMNGPWNAAGNGTTDDAAKLNACMAWLKTNFGGGVMDLTHKHLISGADLIVPRYVSVKMRLGTGSVGDPSFFGHTNAFADMAAAPKLIMAVNRSLKSGTTGGSGAFESIIFGREGLNYDGNDSPDDYEGTAAILTTASGIAFRYCTFLGFEKGVFSDGSSQIRWEYCQFDGLNSIHQRNGFDINTVLDCRSYNFLQAGITGNTDPRTKRDGIAYLCDGNGNGGHQFINTFAYGYRKAFSMQTAGSYSFPGCWADGGHDAETGKSYWPDGCGFELISGNLAANAECQVMGFKASAQTKGVYVGPNMYGATLITNFHMWECTDGIVVDNPNVIIGQGAIRGYFNSAIKYGDAASANGSSITDLLLYGRQGAPNTPVDIDCGGGDPVRHNVRYIGGPIVFANHSAYTVTPVSQFISYDFNREFMFVDGQGIVGDAGPKVAGKVIGFGFLQDTTTHFGGPDGPSTFYNDETNGNFRTYAPFKATAGSVIWFYRNKENTKWVEMNRTLFNNSPQPSAVVVSSTGAFNIRPYDGVVVINKSASETTQVNLPANPPTGKRLVVKDGKGDAATRNVTIVPAAGTIDGAANRVINVNYGSVDLVYNGVQWNVI